MPTSAGASDTLGSSTLDALSTSGALAGALPSATHVGGTTTASLGGETVSLPSSGLSPITLSGSTSLGLSLPTGTTGSGVEIAPSSTLYASPLHYSVTATITTSGVREAVTLEDASAPSTYSYPLTLPAGEFLSANPDGSVSVMSSFSGGSISVGEFLAPWAKDATGTPVPTSYSVVGDTLVQHVETTPSTVFPVVADPYITWGWGPYWNLTGATIKHDFPVWQSTYNSDVASFGVSAAFGMFGTVVGTLIGGWFGAIFGTLVSAYEGALFGAEFFPTATSAMVNRELINIDTSACFQYTLPGNQSYSVFNP